MAEKALVRAQLIDVLTGEGVEVSATGCLVTDPDLPYERLVSMLRAAGAAGRAIRFIIGDLILYTEDAFGESYAQAAEATGLSPETLMNYVSVCRRVARSRRRAHYDYCARAKDETADCTCPGVSFSVHSEVAGMEPEEQKRWLDRVCAAGLTRAELRAELVVARADRKSELPPASLWKDTGGRHDPPPLNDETIDRAENGARSLLERPPPDGSPAWQMNAEELARSTLTLAPAARAALPETAERLLERTQLGLLRDACHRLIRAAEADEADSVLVRVPRAILNELADLSADED